MKTEHAYIFCIVPANQNQIFMKNQETIFTYVHYILQVRFFYVNLSYGCLNFNMNVILKSIVFFFFTSQFNLF